MPRTDLLTATPRREGQRRLRWLCMFALGSCMRITPATEPPATVRDDVYLEAQQGIAVDDARTLNLYCVGQGAPTVLLDAGAGESMMVWRHVHWHVATTTRTCAYDRAGYGFSAPRAQMSDADHIVDDLHRLLQRAGERTPIIYVGHSAAALYGTLLVGRHPEDVAGAVFVDPMIPRAAARLGSLMPPAARNAERQWQRETLSWLSHCTDQAGRPAGLRDTTCTSTSGYRDSITPALRTILARQYARRGTMETALSEYGCLWPDADERVRDDEQVAMAPADWTTRALTILTRDAAPGLALPGMTATSTQAFESARLAALRDMARQSPHGQMIIVPHTGHHIQFDRPEAVVRAITRMVAQLRSVSGAQPR